MLCIVQTYCIILQENLIKQDLRKFVHPKGHAAVVVYFLGLGLIIIHAHFQTSEILLNFCLRILQSRGHHTSIKQT